MQYNYNKLNRPFHLSHDYNNLPIYRFSSSVPANKISGKMADKCSCINDETKKRQPDCKAEPDAGNASSDGNCEATESGLNLCDICKASLKRLVFISLKMLTFMGFTRPKVVPPTKTAYSKKSAKRRTPITTRILGKIRYQSH